MRYLYRTGLQRNIIVKSIIASLFISFVLAFPLLSDELRETNNVFENDFAKVFLTGYQGYTSIFSIAVFILVTIPFASWFVRCNQSGYEKNIVVRIGQEKYVKNMFIINGVISGITVINGMVLYLIVCFILFNKNIDIESFINLTNISPYGIFANVGCITYIVVIIIHCAVVCSVFSNLGLAASFFVKKKIVAILFPFAFAIVVSFFAIFIGITKLEPLSIIQVSRVKGMTIPWIIIYLTVIEVGAYFLARMNYIKESRNDNNT